MQTENAVEIAKVNDAFRRSGSGIVITPGIQEIDDLSGLLEEVRWFNEFAENNDPYGEHDFGTVHWSGEKVFWKIDITIRIWNTARSRYRRIVGG